MSKQVRNAFLSAGHSTNPSRDRGASGNGFIEGVEAAKVVNRVAQICRQKYGLKITVDAGDTILRDIINLWNRATTSNCILIEWHFNAAGPNVRGTETFVDDNANDAECKIAYALSHVAHIELKTPKRGLFKGYSGVRPERESARKSLGWMRLTGHNALPEIEFISNAQGMKSYEDNFEAYCQGCAIVIWYFCHGKENELMERIK